MAIATTDLRIFASVNMPEDDTGISGGAIDKTTTVKAMSLTGSTIPKIKSTDVGDITQVVTITGRDGSGAIVSDNGALNGTTLVNLTVTFSALLKISVSAATGGKVEIYESDGTTLIVSIDSDDTTNGTLNNRRPFYNANSQVGVSKIRFEKIYIYNDHDTLTHIGTKSTLVTDPQNVLKVGAESSANQSVANRLTEPTDVDFLDPTVLNGDIAPNTGLGTWLQYTLGPGQSGFDSVFSFQYAGSST